MLFLSLLLLLLFTYFITIYSIKIILLFRKIYCYYKGISYNGINYKVDYCNFNELQLNEHFYIFKNIYNEISDNDFINILDIFIEDIQNFYFKEKYLTFYIIFFEFNNKNNLYNVLNEPILFNYDFEHYYSGESLFNDIN